MSVGDLVGPSGAAFAIAGCELEDTGLVQSGNAVMMWCCRRWMDRSAEVALHT